VQLPATMLMSSGPNWSPSGSRATIGNRYRWRTRRGCTQSYRLLIGSIETSSQFGGPARSPHPNQATTSSLRNSCSAPMAAR
jgi:hypothetical protein